MDYEHDDRRAADVPGANGAEESGLPAGREPGPDASGLTGSGQADDLFDAMFLSGGMRPPAFAAVDHDLGFPPPEAPDLASAFLAALDAIDDRRFVTPVPDEPPAPPVSLAEPAEPAALIAPVETAALADLAEPAAGESLYELRPQSRLELESEETSELVDEPSAEPVSAAEGAGRLPWDTGRVPVAGLLTMGSAAENGEEAAEDVEEFASAEDAEPIEEIEEAAYYAAGVDGDAGDEDAAEAAAIIAAEADEEAEAAAAAAAQAAADAEEAAAAARAEADAEAEALARAIADAEQAELEADIAAEGEQADLDAAIAAEAEQAELEAAIAAEAALDETSGGADEMFAASAGAADVSDVASSTPAFDASLDDVFDTAFDTEALDTEALDTEALDAGVLETVALDATLDAPIDAASDASIDADPSTDDPFAAPPAFAAPLAADLTPGDDDLELEPSIGSEPMDAAPMTFDGPDAFAPVAAAEPEPEPEPESDEVEELQDFVVFSLGDMRCVVPIRNVVEVGRIPDAAPVPNAPAWLYGLGNLRGQVLSLIDLRAFFNIGRIKASAGRMVVLRGDSDDITAGVMVDQVHQIVALSPSRFKGAPAELPLPERSAEFVWGACDYGNFTMIGLDVDGVLGVESLTEETV